MKVFRSCFVCRVPFSSGSVAVLAPLRALGDRPHYIERVPAARVSTRSLQLTCVSLCVMVPCRVSRGFLLRRISTLVFDNMDSFHPRQLASIFESLALLRFLTLENAEELLARLSPTVTRLPTKYLMNILNGLVVLDFPRVEAVRACVDAVSKDDVATLPRTHAIGVAHALLQFQMYGT